ANIKNEPTEILHETLPMDISYGGDALATSLQIENSTKENKITIKEEIKKEQETVDNISGIAGGEMPMDLC
uniref:Uncharacterized protein n=1 Tax=Meloidogyne javanica TaxID=6303 RepID=A0A915LLA0_MELJA